MKKLTLLKDPTTSLISLILAAIPLPEQTSFRQGRSTLKQATRMSQDIQDYFEDKKKADAVLLDLTAAYDTVWHRCFACKLITA